MRRLGGSVVLMGSRTFCPCLTNWLACLSVEVLSLSDRLTGAMGYPRPVLVPISWGRGFARDCKKIEAKLLSSCCARELRFTKQSAVLYNVGILRRELLFKYKLKAFDLE